MEGVGYSTSRSNCETGLWGVEWEVENLSAKVVNLILASFSEKRSRQTPWVQLLSPDFDPVKIWHKMAWSDATSAHSDFEFSLAIGFLGLQRWVWGETVNSYPSQLFFVRKAWGGLFALHRCCNKARVFFPFLEDCLCLAACFDGCKTNKIRPSSPTESDSWEENPMKGCRGNEQRRSRVGSRWLSWEHTANSVKKGGWGDRTSIIFAVLCGWPNFNYSL